MKIFPQTMSDLTNELISNRGDCRTAPATPGLLIKHSFAVQSMEQKIPPT